MKQAYSGPVVTADVALWRVADDGMEVLLAKREDEPFAGEWALPGVWVHQSETMAEAGTRALASKANAEVPPGAVEFQTEVYDNIAADPRGHSLSVVTTAVVPGGASDIPGNDEQREWRQADQATGLAFDHDEVVAKSHRWIRQNLWTNLDLFQTVVGDLPLTTATVRRLVGAVEGTVPDTSNLRRRMASSGMFSPIGTAAPNGRGRPSAAWDWRYPDE